MMRLIPLLCFAAILPTIAAAETVVAARTIRAQTTITPEDLTSIAAMVPGAIIAKSEAVGLEARVVLYSGRPIMAGDIGPAAIIERNQVINVIYQASGLKISAAARALGRAGPGDLLRVMNLTSKSTVSGIVAPDGTVYVGDLPGT